MRWNGWPSLATASAETVGPLLTIRNVDHPESVLVDTVIQPRSALCRKALSRRFVIGVTALTVVFTWLYNNTCGSLILAILLHASFNSAGAVLMLFHASPGPPSDLTRTLVLVAVALIIIALTRGQLGLPRATALAAPPPSWQTPR